MWLRVSRYISVTSENILVYQSILETPENDIPRTKELNPSNLNNDHQDIYPPAEISSTPSF